MYIHIYQELWVRGVGGTLSTNGPVESFRRWVPMSRFKRGNQELLALYIFRDMTFFVVHKGSLAV